MDTDFREKNSLSIRAFAFLAHGFRKHLLLRRKKLSEKVLIGEMIRYFLFNGLNSSRRTHLAVGQIFDVL